ncbi:MAG: type IV pilus assembly protein PilM [Candidatus Wildermuthbacteria bacterium]|nr:type IV pilus assembly protein PilM [Candidatus Wildermuthbacteria bacterium]
MIFQSFPLFPKSYLGIDIGTSAIKLVELSGWTERRTLKNYGEIKSESLYQEPFRTFEKNTLSLSSEEIAKAIRAVMEESKIHVKKAIFSIPDFSTFFTNFEMPPMDSRELAEAVRFEARRHVPVPLSEVSYGWQIIEGPQKKLDPFKILMVAVPNESINQYQEIAKMAGVELAGLEAEVFGIIRSCLQKGDRGVTMLLDIGAQTTTISVVEKGMLRSSNSVDIAGKQFSERIASSGRVDFKTAEDMKIKDGLLLKVGTSEVLLPQMDALLQEMHRIAQSHKTDSGKDVEKVVVAGGSALLKGIKEFFEKDFVKNVSIASPFQHVFYPPLLEETLKKSGPAYAVAVGMALRGFE